MIQAQEAEEIYTIISEIAENIYKKYITATTMIPLILSKDKKHEKNLQILDCLYQSVLTSLQFGQYKRAVWYLQAFSLECDKILGDNNTMSIILTLQKLLQN